MAPQLQENYQNRLMGCIEDQKDCDELQKGYIENQKDCIVDQRDCTEDQKDCTEDQKDYSYHHNYYNLGWGGYIRVPYCQASLPLERYPGEPGICQQQGIYREANG